MNSPRHLLTSCPSMSLPACQCPSMSAPGTLPAQLPVCPALPGLLAGSVLLAWLSGPGGGVLQEGAWGWCRGVRWAGAGQPAHALSSSGHLNTSTDHGRHLHHLLSTVLLILPSPGLTHLWQSTTKHSTAGGSRAHSHTIPRSERRHHGNAEHHALGIG